MQQQQIEKTLRNFFDFAPASRSVNILGGIYSQWVESGEYDSNPEPQKAAAAHEFTRVISLITELEDSTFESNSASNRKSFTVMKNEAIASTPERVDDSKQSLLEGQQLLEGMIQELARRIRSYGEEEHSAVWAFHLIIEEIHTEVLNRNNWEDGQRMVWALNTFGKPYRMEEYKPVALTTEEYASQLLRGIMDTVAVHPSWFTREKHEQVREAIETGLEELADTLINIRDYGLPQLTERLNVLNIILEVVEQG